MAGARVEACDVALGVAEHHQLSFEVHGTHVRVQNVLGQCQLSVTYVIELDRQRVDQTGLIDADKRLFCVLFFFAHFRRYRRLSTMCI